VCIVGRLYCRYHCKLDELVLKPDRLVEMPLNSEVVQLLI
jgi:hypothetical protein